MMMTTTKNKEMVDKQVVVQAAQEEDAGVAATVQAPPLNVVGDKEGSENDYGRSTAQLQRKRR